jgi:hypothetical protein
MTLQKAMALANGEKADKTVPQALEICRIGLGLSVKEMSAALDLHRSTYSEVINHKKSLSIRASKRAYALGVPAHVLLQP